MLYFAGVWCCIFNCTTIPSQSPSRKSRRKKAFKVDLRCACWPQSLSNLLNRQRNFKWPFDVAPSRNEGLFSRFLLPQCGWSGDVGQFLPFPRKESTMMAMLLLLLSRGICMKHKLNIRHSSCRRVNEFCVVLGV